MSLRHQPFKTKAVFLDADEIFTLRFQADELKQCCVLEQQDRKHLEVLEKILAQCDGQKFEGE